MSRPVATRTTALVVRAGVGGDFESLARQAGLHPDVVRRLGRLGLLDQAGGGVRAPLPARDAAARLARAARLRGDLGLSWSGAVMACDLLARIDELERRLSRYEPIRRRPNEP
jgi:chaperone modulatory protein CbpM